MDRVERGKRMDTRGGGGGGGEGGGGGGGGGGEEIGHGVGVIVPSLLQCVA